jgi:hypothetical protein
LGPRFDDHDGAHPLPQHRIRHRDGRDAGDTGQAVDEVLDLLGGDLLTAPVDHVLVASFDDEIARGVHPDYVAAAIPAVQTVRIRLRLALAEDVPVGNTLQFVAQGLIQPVPEVDPVTLMEGKASYAVVLPDTPPTELATTGPAPVWFLALGCVTAVGAGALLVRIRRIRGTQE